MRMTDIDKTKTDHRYELLIQHFTADTDDLRKRTRDLIFELKKESAYLPTIVIHELYKEQCETLGKDTAETRLKIILQSGFEVVNLDYSIAKETARIRCKHTDLPTPDGIIAATALVTGSLHVVTDDPHFERIREIKTEWI